MTDDVVLNKTASIERCVKRVQEEYVPDEFLTNLTKQDAILLNLQRAYNTSIFLANYIVHKRNLCFPQNTLNVFQLLEKNKFIDPALSKNLQSMVGFRNIAVHDYTELNLEIIKAIIEKRLEDFRLFCKAILKMS